MGTMRVVLSKGGRSKVQLLLTMAVLTLRAEGLTVTDQKGRSIEIDVVSLSGDSVIFRREGNAKEYTVPVNQFDVASQESIRKVAAALPAVIPKIQADVVIGKRRKAMADSYYMVIQEITSTIKLTNPSKTDKVPPITGKIVFIGQNSKNPDLMKVLSVQGFETSIDTGKTVVKETDPFSTRYDSDNKGAGNIGGFQYYGYLLALLDAEGNVLLEQTTTGSFRIALAEKSGLIKMVLEYSVGTTLSPKLETALP